MKKRYAGPGPHDATMVGGGIIRPGDVAEFDEEPDFGPWEDVDEPEAAPEVIPVKEQIAAGVPPEATVTIADQRNGVPPPPIPPVSETTES